MPTAKNFFTDAQKDAIRKAIEEAERQTSGEIRVHIENACKDEAVKCAEEWFGKLKMHETAEHNGVLFYLAVKSRVFAIYGGKGINEKVPAGFWDTISAHMEKHFREGNFTEGLAEGIAMAGEQLKVHFPLRHDDKDELTNEISFK